MAIRKSQVYLSLVNSYLIDSPQPSTINYWYNLGSLLGLCLVIQIASGIFLAMHYSSHIDLAFASVEHKSS
jgi:ubiquinol-cytochrome c reductase cytochrome b subunit